MIEPEIESYNMIASKQKFSGFIFIHAIAGITSYEIRKKGSIWSMFAAVVSIYITTELSKQLEP